MDDFHYKPAHDLGLSQSQRLRSADREPGIVGLITRHTWWWSVRAYLALFQHVTVLGKENLPTAAPFLLVCNHASHFDALLLGAALPLPLRNVVFPIAAGDTFFETPAITLFAAGLMNALPLWRKNAGHHAMDHLRHRLTDPPCGYILFPEGTRSRTGDIAKFRAGIGMLIAGSPVPVIPCHLDGTFHAWPPTRKFPRRARITLHIGPALSFSNTPNNRDGWNAIAITLETAVRSLAPALSREQ